MEGIEGKRRGLCGHPDIKQRVAATVTPPQHHIEREVTVCVTTPA
jgi:hypothetical protein